MNLRKIITLLFKPFTLGFWYIQKLIPRNKNVWLFGAGEGYRYADNAKWLYEYVLDNHKEVEAIWVTKSKAIYQQLKLEGKPVIFAYSIRGIIKSLRSGFIFLTNKPSDFNANTINGACQVWLWHGVMMKYIGLDSNKFSYDKLSFFGKIKRKLYQFLYPENTYRPDFVINTADFFTSFFVSAFNLRKDQIWITGYPRNDVLLSDKTDSLIKKINVEYNNPFKILYLPTWRSEEKGKEFMPFDSYNFNLKDYQDYLSKENMVFLSKSHSFEGKSFLNKETNRFIDLNNYNYDDLYLLMKDIDLLITDFSSVYFDFLLTGKPVLLAPFDYEVYTTNVKPLYYDYFEIIEGVKARDWVEILNIIKQKSYFSISKNKFHQYTDSQSSKRIVELVQNKAWLNK